MRLTLILCSLTAARAFFGPPRPPRNPRLSSSYGDDDDDGMALNSAASTAITLAVGASMPTLARRALRRKAPAPAVAGAPSDPNSFAGTWKLARSENMDAYLKSLNVSAAHRRLAAGASVTHEIEQTGRDCVDVCVVTRLGRSREQQKVGATRTGKDQYKRPITKRTTWESGNKLKTTTESEVGTVTDVRERIGDGMVITLTSPANVVARRYFERVGGGPVVAASASPAKALAPVPIVCGVATGFVAGRLTARGRGRLAPARA